MPDRKPTTLRRFATPLLGGAVAFLATLPAVGLAAHSGDLWLLGAQVAAAGACLGVTVLWLGNLGPARGSCAADFVPHDRQKSNQTPAVDPLEDGRWLRLVEGLVTLLDELESHRSHFDPAARDLADHIDSRLTEVVERAGVAAIDGEASFDRNRHQPEQGAAHARPGDAVLETIRPGLAVGRKVFRRAKVRLTSGSATDEGESTFGHPERIR